MIGASHKLVPVCLLLLPLWVSVSPTVNCRVWARPPPDLLQPGAPSFIHPHVPLPQLGPVKTILVCRHPAGCQKPSNKQEAGSPVSKTESLTYKQSALSTAYPEAMAGAGWGGGAELTRRGIPFRGHRKDITQLWLDGEGFAHAKALWQVSSTMSCPWNHGCSFLKRRFGSPCQVARVRPKRLQHLLRV